jgi:hypothetical protein
MSAGMVSSSLNAMHEIKKTKTIEQNHNRIESADEADEGRVVYKKGNGTATMAKARVVGIRVS